MQKDVSVRRRLSRLSTCSNEGLKAAAEALTPAGEKPQPHDANPYGPLNPKPIMLVASVTMRIDFPEILELSNHMNPWRVTLSEGYAKPRLAEHLLFPCPLARGRCSSAMPLCARGSNYCARTDDP